MGADSIRPPPHWCAPITLDLEGGACERAVTGTKQIGRGSIAPLNRQRLARLWLDSRRKVEVEDGASSEGLE